MVSPPETPHALERPKGVNSGRLHLQQKHAGEWAQETNSESSGVSASEVITDGYRSIAEGHAVISHNILGLLRRLDWSEPLQLLAS